MYCVYIYICSIYIYIMHSHSIIHMWDCIKTRYLFQLPKITLSFFVSSYGFLSWWAPCGQEVRIFQLSVGMKESLVESQRMSSVAFISFHRLSCCINFLSCSFHFAFIPFHVAFISFHVAFMSFLMFRSGGYPPKRSRVCHISLSSWLSFSYRFGGLCRLQSQASWTCTYISSLSFFSYYHFLGRQHIGSVKVQAKLKCNARVFYTIPFQY